MINYDTGVASTILLTTAGLEFNTGSTQGGNPTSGKAFTYTMPGGMNQLGGVNGNTSTPARLTFSGLSASTTYELTFSVVRNKRDATRTSIFQITGADTFFNDSDAAISTTALANDTATIFAGTSPVAGLAARFTQVTSGVDGTLVIKLSTDNNRYYLNAMNLTAIPEPSTYAALVGGLILVGF